MGNKNNFQDGVVELDTKDGVAFIEQASPLTRLHYFDGKFLRADAFAQEQDYHRARTRLSNIAGGWGVVNGLGIKLSGNQLTVGAGMAITAAGNFVLATGDMHADITDLIKVAAPAPIGGNPEFDDCFEVKKKGVKETASLGIYEITVGPIEGLCGSEAVYGKLCESACVSDSQHPYWREGVVLRLRPISLKLPGSTAVTFSASHLRNRVASAYFAAEPWLTASALSAAGLASDLWCNPASLYGRDEVVIGLLVREAGANRVIDAWSGRRERMDTQARGYWQGRMAMRPWNVFTAHILQFQCQLAALFDKVDMVIKPSDECGQLRVLLDKTRKELEALHQKYNDGAQKILKQFGEKPTKKEMEFVANEVKTSYAELYEISSALASTDIGKGVLPKRRLLLNSGFVELPPAGYLPVSPGKVGIEEQCSRMFGEGVRLHYHAVRADEIAHLVEEAQHLERISLTRGLDDPKKLEDVEIFVPDGTVIDTQAQAAGTWWQVDMRYDAIRELSLAVRDNKDKQQATRDQILEQAGTQVLAQANEVPQAILELKDNKRSTKTKTAAAKAKTEAKTTTIRTNIESLRIRSANNARLKEEETVEAAAPAAPAAEREIPQDTGRFNRVESSALAGLARTESHEDGSYGFTLVAAADALNTDDGSQGKLAYRIKADYPALQRGHSLQDSRGNLMLYFSADIEKDPFDLQIGDDIRIKAEMRLMGGLSTEVSVANGQLTVLSQRSAENGFIERLVQVDILINETLFGKAEGPETRTDRNSLRFNIMRKGDADTGKFLLDDEKHNPKNSPVFFEWDDSPRRAVMYVMSATVQEAVSLKIIKALRSKVETLPIKEEISTSFLPDRGDTGSGSTLTRQQLLSMNALAGIPAITGTDGAAALNALVAIADASDDPAFLVRARRRLFPTLDAPTSSEVRGTHDWLMFRRARTHLCPPVCVRKAAPTVEAFQVWHIKIDSAKQLKLLEAGLDKGDAKVIGQFKFQRVGILRYRDESAYSEESADRVRQMWQFAQPGKQVAIGRVWESAPTTGQGWQNHFRLRNMLEQIASLTQPPVRGDGALAAIPAPPYPLADGALDGGMLVVTMAGAVQLKPHRTILLPYTYYSDLEPVFKKNPDDAWARLQQIVTSNTGTVVDLSLNFNASNQIDTDSLKKLLEGDAKMMSGRTDFGYQIWVRRVDAMQIDSATDPAARHKAVSDNVGKGVVAANRFEDPAVKLQTADLGGGAQTASVVFYLSVVEIG